MIKPEISGPDFYQAATKRQQFYIKMSSFMAKRRKLSLKTFRMERKPFSVLVSTVEAITFAPLLAEGFFNKKTAAKTTFRTRSHGNKWLTINTFSG